MKKKLTHSEEFKILTLVMDKLLWVSTFLVLFGFYNITVEKGGFIAGPGYLAAGSILFAIFVMVLVKEYEFIK